MENLDNGLYNFVARFYDTNLGRFYGTDPAGQFSNPYVGIGNNTINFADPDGEWVFWAASTLFDVINGYSRGGIYGAGQALQSSIFSGIGSSGYVPSNAFGAGHAIATNLLTTYGSGSKNVDYASLGVSAATGFASGYAR